MFSKDTRKDIETKSRLQLVLNPYAAGLPPSQISVFDWSSLRGPIRKISAVLCVHACGFQAAASKTSRFPLKSDNAH